MTPRMAPKPSIRLLAGFCLLLAALQLLLFLPQVIGGHAVDFALFRIDALSLAFGVVWTLALLGISHSAFRIHWVFSLLFIAGLLGMAYAREPLVLLVGWEMAGLVLWRPVWEGGRGTDRARLALSIHLPGLLLLGAILLVPVGPFVPPQGGEAAPWSLFVAISFGIVALWRAGCWLFRGRGLFGGSARPLVMSYVFVSPYLLAKALVAAPWDDFGVWALALLGTLALIGSLLAAVLGADSALAIALGCVAAVVAGMGLAPASPLAAMGAVALALAAPLWASASTPSYRGALFLVAALLGIWLLSEGALDARYRLVAALVLPALFLLSAKVLGKVPSTECQVPSASDRLLGTWYSVLGTIALVAVAIFPQAAVEWVIRPVVGAMAGGVAFPSELVTNWGLGLTAQSAQEQIVASLPATGIALALFLAWVALYWLRALVLRASNDS